MIRPAWSINDCVVPLLSIEFFGGARDGHTAFAFFFLPVHVEGKCEGALAQTLSLFLQFLELTLWQATQLEDKPASGSTLPTIDMAADHNGKVLLLRVCRHGCAASFHLPGLETRYPAAIAALSPHCQLGGELKWKPKIPVKIA
jgi:hypothetical protein